MLNSKLFYENKFLLNTMVGASNGTISPDWLYDKSDLDDFMFIPYGIRKTLYVLLFTLLI